MARASNTKIFVITSNDLIAGALKVALNYPGIEVSIFGNDLLHEKLNTIPDVIIIDDAHCSSIFALAEQLQIKFSKTKLIYISNSLNPVKVALASQHGFSGILCCHDQLMSRLLDIIERVLMGKTYYSETAMDAYQDYLLNKKAYVDLTPTRVKILNMMMEGYNPQQIAEKCVCTVHAIYHHQSKLRDQFGASDNSDLITKVRTMYQWSNHAVKAT